MRSIEARAALGRLARAKVVLHPKVAEYAQNSRRRELADLERTYRISVEIVGDPGAELSTERFEWFDVPAWEIPGVPDSRTVDEGDDRSPAESTSPTDGERIGAPPGNAAPPRPIQEQREGAGGGKRSRRKRRRRGRKRDGSAQEPTPGEWGEHPAASIGSVVEVQGNVAPEPEVSPADGGQSHETVDAHPSSRRRRRRRRRVRGEGAADTKESPLTSQEVSAESISVHQDKAREVTPAAVSFPLGTEQPSPTFAPAPSGARVPEVGGETDMEALAPREEPPGEKLAKRPASKKAALPKKRPKDAPKKAAARKGAAEKAPPKEPGVGSAAQ
jgi:ribonuclease E